MGRGRRRRRGSGDREGARHEPRCRGLPPLARRRGTRPRWPSWGWPWRPAPVRHWAVARIHKIRLAVHAQAYRPVAVQQDLVAKRTQRLLVERFALLELADPKPTW